MREFYAEVVDVRDEGVTDGRRRWRLLLTEPLSEGKGVLVAVSPGGARLEVPVLGVVVEDADRWHIVEKPLATGTPLTGQAYGEIERQVE